MTAPEEELRALQRALERERKARKEAEQIIELKSSELFALNEALRNLNGSLEEKIRARTDELEILNTALREAMVNAQASTQAKSAFLSTVSHEIRTPLNGIIGLTAILDKKINDPELAHIVDNIKFSSDTLLSLINDVLDLSAIESGKLKVLRAPFDPTYLCQRICEAFQYRAGEKNVELECVIPSDLPTAVIGDAAKVNQILTNLIGNALKFTSRGTVKLSLHTHALANESVELIFIIEDTGIGIAQYQLDEIFEEFVQAKGSIRENYGGSGLGLSIVAKLVNLLQGRIEVDSSEGHGSRFSVTLPFELHHVAPQNTKKNQFSQVDSIKGMRVLLAEDLEINQYIVRELMRDWQVELEITNNGQEALDALKQRAFDLVLLDMHMPVLNGLEAARYIRSGKYGDANIPLVGLTADVFDDTRDALTEAGVNEMLTKPFNIHHLMETLVRFAPNHLKNQ
jgi:signal transduction histidine kinase/ActR/RegA family two-component response regulator